MLRRLLDALRGRSVPASAPPAPSADHAGDRETSRVGRLSAEERAWEAASQQRSRERDTAAADHAAAQQARDLASGEEHV
jgi:hypothetical protein